MEFKGTKGEWKVTKSNTHESKVATDKYRIAGVKHYYKQINHVLLEPSKEEGQANAQLIAAAPELLEALIIAKKALDAELKKGGILGITNGEYNAIEQAINKALNK